MLLVGDIHINAHMRSAILQSLRDMVEEHSNEKTIIFLGDYVYHFAYDRKSLLMLFLFFVELYRAGKHVYVLAGNHDWIADHFVYEEAQQAFSIVMEDSFDTAILGNSLESRGFLRFITELTVLDIEGQRVVFLPYNIAIEPDAEVFVSDDSHLQLVSQALRDLEISTNKRDHYSYAINKSLLQTVERLRHSDPDDDILVIHHYYVEGVEFPGQRSRFSFKDIALSKERLSVPYLRMISGHLHQPFVYKNYLCVGSVWSTSPLEINHYKATCLLHGSSVLFIPSHIKYYLRILYDGKVVDAEYIANFLEKQYVAFSSLCADHDFFSIDVSRLRSLPNLSLLSLQMVGNSLDCGHIDDYVASSVFDAVETVRLKRQDVVVEQLLQQLDLSSKNLQSGFHDWKSILKDYIGIKYPSEQQEYLALLEEMRLL